MPSTGAVTHVDVTWLSVLWIFPRLFSVESPPNLQLVQRFSCNSSIDNCELSRWSEITGGYKEVYDSVFFLWAAAVQYEDPVYKLKDTIKEGTARPISSLKPVTKVPGVIFGTGQLYDSAQLRGP